MKNTLAEFIGTFFLTLVVGLTMVPPSVGPFAPLAIGAIYMVMICAIGGVSGGYFNPAVTLAAWIRGTLPTRRLLPYALAQIIAAVLAGLLVVFMRGGVASPLLTPDPTKALLAELLFTFALVFVVLNTTTSMKQDGQCTQGLATGFTLMASAYAITGISGAALNPAVAAGMSVMGLSTWSTIWIFFVANFAGGALAAMIHKVTSPPPVGGQ
jgi:aquaporin Z